LGCIWGVNMAALKISPGSPLLSVR